MHVLKQMGTLEPPIRDLTNEEVLSINLYLIQFVKIYKGIWVEDNCLRESLIYILNDIEPCLETESIL